MVETATQGDIGSEGIGIAAAAIILLLVFGSVVAAGLPILVALVGLGVSASLVGVVAAVIDVPDWSTSLAAMMGIGVGVDYVLLLVTRYREYLGRGLSPRAATMATADTAGRAVLVAGSTVVVSLLGLFGMGLTAMRGAAVVTIIAVLVVMLAAVTLLPALLGFVGHRIDRLRLPVPRSSAPSRWAPAGRSAVQRRPWLALGARARAARAAGAAVPGRPLRLPGRRQRPRRHHHPAGVRHARRRLRPGRERPAAAGRRGRRRRAGAGAGPRSRPRRGSRR